MAKTDFSSMEKKWQKKWEDAKIFRTGKDPKKKKYYVLEMFPYPSAAGLHMGHIRNYSMGDAVARYKRMKGFNVLYPMGYDAFGLPAENAAIKHKTHPKKYTEDAIEGIKKNQKALGLSYDWEKEIATCYPEYYKWNQWFFLKALEKGLAYKKESPVNWCPDCNTVLANEQVENGRCWRCGSDVEEKKIEQWFFRITDYADELLDGLKKLDGWPEKIKLMQENWIGKSLGVDIHFRLEGTETVLPTFTTRCDTVFSVTFLAVAPEHPMIEKLIKGTGKEKEVSDFIKKVKKESIIDRTNEEKEKAGVFTGKYAINPVNGERVPIYVSNFALMYGSGIVMCDAHDKRDFRFARKYNIPLKFVISGNGKPIDPKDFEDAFTDDGVLFNSGKFSGMNNREALPKMAEWIEKNKIGKKVVNYKIRDWGISRQRYWGTPIPVVYCDKCGMQPVREKDLPVILPTDVRFTGEGNPLKASEKFVNCKCPKCSGKGKRETDTMDTFVDSSWYFLRYCNPKSSGMFDEKAIRYWMPVDQYIGGAEHAVMHLLYARFFTKVLRDIGLLSFGEPFLKLFNQGIVYRDGHKMSKSFGNAVTQEEVSKKYGIDTARMFLLFVASPESQLEWDDNGIQGTHRFLSRLFKLVAENIKNTEEGTYKATSVRDRILEAKTSLTISNVSRQIEDFQFNLALGTILEFVNYLYSYTKGDINRKLLKHSLKSLVQLLTPFGPHAAEELWSKLGGKGFVSSSEWPKAKKTDKKALAMEAMMTQLGSDIDHVIRLANMKPSKISIIISPEWKYLFVEKVKEHMEKTRNPGEIMKVLMSEGRFRPYGKDVSRLVPIFVKSPERMPSVLLGQKTEKSLMNEMKPSLESEFSCSVVIETAEKSASNKAVQAMPGKPGIEVS